MSTFDTTLNHRRRVSHALGYDPSLPPMDPTNSHNGANVSSPTDSLISPLQPYTYDPSAASRSMRAASFEQYASNASINGFTADPPHEGNSQDPHGFYRQYHDQFSPATSDRLGQGDIVVGKQEDSMTTSRRQRRPSPTQRVNGAKPAPMLSRVQSNHASRYSASPSSTAKSPLSATKSNPAISSTARNRHTSLKDLVDRFNQTPDEVPPLPSRTQSRSTSTNSNPPVSGYSRARTSSQSKPQGRSSQEQPPRTQQRRGRSGVDGDKVRGSVIGPHGGQAKRSTSNGFASQSMVDLAPESGRQPLFGEVLSSNGDHLDPGYGIPIPRRRRGSEGSMHSPNPMFPDERKRFASSPPPSSPSAWYRGHAPTLEEIKQERALPELPPAAHRRTRSDFTGIPSGPPTKTHNAFRVPPKDTPSLSPHNIGTKRDSQSRIPLSSRRLSLNSDSGNSTPSTRNNSAMDRHPTHITSPPKGSSALPVPRKQPQSPPHTLQSPSTRKSPRRGDIARDLQRISTSPRLAAFISAPLPKKSPPLRSSRPRQPVSSASTSASRARAADRYSPQENGSPRSPKDYKHKRPPELGGVDFAARRQKIQQAFTKTVKENEVEAERRRASVAQEPQNQARDSISSFSPVNNSEGHEHADEDGENVSLEDAHAHEEDVFQTPAEELARSERELTINTGHLSERSVLDLSQEDSPTLGVIGRFTSMNRVSEGDTTPTSDNEPSSAVTAGTSDSVDTFFDDEPQDEDAEPEAFPPQPEQRTLMSHIMSIRDRSPASPTRLQQPVNGDETSSERDDRESIQIMLRDTPVLEKPEISHLQQRDSAEDSTKDGNRWGITSWTSSAKVRDSERDVPMESIDELSPTQTHPREPNHLSVSTVTSESTQQPWSPATFASPQTARSSTLDSDAYSTINRVLDQYHDPSSVSPSVMQDVQQQIFTQSPDLARAGGWDPKKVTQLYLQQLARDRAVARGNGLPAVPEPLKYKTHRTAPTQAMQSPTSAPQQQDDRDASNEKILSPTVMASHSRSQSLEVNDGDDYTLTHRASMNHPGDWDMSPSIADWIAPQAEDSPSDERPPVSSKTWEKAKRELSELDDQAVSRPAHISTDFRPQLPEIKGAGEGLGLAINITSPQDSDSPKMLPPPGYIPPPPPPIESIEPKPPSPPAARPQKTHSVQGKRVSSTVPSLPGQTSGDSSRQSGTTIASSVQPSGSSSVSGGRPSVEERSTLQDLASKPVTSSADQKRLTRRRHIIKELVDTEHSFGQDMKVVDDIYKGTCSVIIISAEDVKTLFGNSDQIIGFSTNFLDALKQASKSVYVLPKSKRWRSNRVSNSTTNSCGTDDQSSINGGELSEEDKDRRTFIGEAFGHHMAIMEKVYGDYLKNHDAANQKLQILQKNEKVQIWLKECHAYAQDLTAAWDLDSLLVKPVQRILKYPLLLDQLLDATPENHPDFTQLDIAAREMKGISMRINEMKKRADIMEQVTNQRKRKESDVRIGLSKAFGRRTEKLRQQVGLSDMVEDTQYSAVSEKFGSHFFQLQVVMRDVEMYTNDVQSFVKRFGDFAIAIEEHIDVQQTSYPEMESKWHKFRQIMAEMTVTALTDHVNLVRKNVIDPMTTLLKLHDGPQKLMLKRNKRVMDYARYKAIKDRGDKLDKKTAEQGEQYLAVNDTLKEELPKLFALTGKLVEACLNNFVQLQLQWQGIWRRKLAQAIDDHKVPVNVNEIVTAFAGDFQFVEAQVLSLGICNGSMLADAANLVGLLSPSTTLNGDDFSASVDLRQTSSLEVSKRRTMSVSSDMSPVLPAPDFGGRENGSFFGNMASASASASNVNSNQRMRASSAVSNNNSPQTPDIPGSYRSYSNSTTPSNSARRPNTATGRSSMQSTSNRPTAETPDFNRMGEQPTMANRPPSGTTYPQINPPRSSSPTHRYSGLFSSALPMSDSPRTDSPVEIQSRREFKVIFLAASVYEFNIDRARREAGYPYLTYVAGEIFDVIGEKGELWLAKNQDDATCQVGWIWNKHFVKLAS